MDEDFDRIVNCPLCGGSLECDHYDWATEWNSSKAYTNGPREKSTAYSYQRVKCPLCDGTGTALARLTEATTNCSGCGGVGSVEMTVKLDVGARREKKQCAACGGNGKRNQQRIEIQTFAAARSRMDCALQGQCVVN